MQEQWLYMWLYDYTNCDGMGLLPCKQYWDFYTSLKEIWTE